VRCVSHFPAGQERKAWIYRQIAGSAEQTPFSGDPTMLQTIAIILIILWLLGLVSSYTMGGFIHILLVIAIVVILLRIFQGRRL
jgi:hypothetical protein